MRRLWRAVCKAKVTVLKGSLRTIRSFFLLKTKRTDGADGDEGSEGSEGREGRTRDGAEKGRREEGAARRRGGAEKGRKNERRAKLTKWER